MKQPIRLSAVAWEAIARRRMRIRARRHELQTSKKRAYPGEQHDLDTEWRILSGVASRMTPEQFIELARRAEYSGLAGVRDLIGRIVAEALGAASEIEADGSASTPPATGERAP